MDGTGCCKMCAIGYAVGFFKKKRYGTVSAHALTS